MFFFLCCERLFIPKVKKKLNSALGRRKPGQSTDVFKDLNSCKTHLLKTGEKTTGRKFRESLLDSVDLVNALPVYTISQSSAVHKLSF